jgi:DNA-binding MarR family transcriptional regulator
MKNINRRDNQKVRDEIDDVFTKIFLLSLKLENIGNTTLKKDQLTIKQFLLIASANMVSTSHQNVKEIADRLEKIGFIRIVRDKKDKRILRLETTKKNAQYWAYRLDEHEDLIFAMFNPFTDKEIHTFKVLINKFLTHLENNF